MHSADQITAFLEEKREAGTLPDTLRGLSISAARVTDGLGASRVMHQMLAHD